MLQKLQINGVKLPRLYIAENSVDVRLAREKGIPFVRWSLGQKELIKMLLRPTLEKMFPYIKWDDILGSRTTFNTKVVIVKPDKLDPETVEETKKTTTTKESLDEGTDDIPPADSMTATDEHTSETADIPINERAHFGDGGGLMPENMLSIEEYIGDTKSWVNLEVLQELKLMPAFIGDILDCVKLNIGSGMHWREGYNKRTAMLSGRYDASYQLPNLIILDVSGSIPRGISATMISLIDTLRSQVSADLIITSSKSKFYPMGCELPTPNQLRKEYGYSNESYGFFEIINDHIQGKHYGHVISFGDHDEPYWNDRDSYSLIGTKVDYVHHYFVPYWRYESTPNAKLRTGYAKWCHMLADEPRVECNTTWCKVIED